MVFPRRVSAISHHACSGKLEKCQFTRYILVVKIILWIIGDPEKNLNRFVFDL